MAGSKERFQSRGHGSMNPATAKAPGRYLGTAPAGWKEISATPIRLLNYTIGSDGQGEVYVSQTQGGVLDNIARWRNQFGIANTTGEDLLKMPRVVILQVGEGLLVEARGTFSPGMGRAATGGYALAGVLGVLGDGSMLTVKMTGPEELVKAERERFLEFCRSLKSLP